MIVLFISQCEKKSIKRTNRILDSFANRIGDRTWKTVITQNGLDSVRKLLKKTASKNTAVACHVIHGSNSSRLLWIVGKRSRFSDDGIVPVGFTSRKIVNSQWENTWDFHGLMTSITALAALFHDIGKSNKAFQDKLRKPGTVIQDPLRHEWISALCISAITGIAAKQNKGFFSYLIEGDYQENQIIEELVRLNDFQEPFSELDDFAFSIVWLILSHHKIPGPDTPNQYLGYESRNINTLRQLIQKDWGYANGEKAHACFTFPRGLPIHSQAWKKQVVKWAKKALKYSGLYTKVQKEGYLRLILHYSRLNLMFADYLYSSYRSTKKNESTTGILYANTDSDKHLNQTLEEHLLGVLHESLSMAHLLPRFETDLDTARDVRSLARKAPAGSPFHWQDVATAKLNEFRKLSETQEHAFLDGMFIVNLASTGCGKTFANAKIMQALNPVYGELRFTLALGLRTLTLQTGNEYRSRVGLDESELAVVIGSDAIADMWDPSFSAGYSDSHESLMDEEIEYQSSIPESRVSAILKDEKSRKLLYSPVLACTVDYMVRATETIRGGKWMLPFLRIMSSDLVIDEIDDFTQKDLIVIGRLIHLAGMLGRKVLISSATIPAFMAEGFFRVYRDGWNIYSAARRRSPQIGCVWIDEFSTTIHPIAGPSAQECCDAFKAQHQAFIFGRVAHIRKNEKLHGIRRKARLIPLEKPVLQNSKETVQEQYFETIRNEILHEHTIHACKDPYSEKLVSFGLVRLAHIDTCIDLTTSLIGQVYPEDIALRVMPYHSRQVLAIRSFQEHHLDFVLTCKNDTRTQAFADPIIRSHIDESKSDNIIFVVVATPIEEIGRDHDFDWAIVEPSSFRSIIQLAGRVRRHRNNPTNNPNIGVLQYSINGLIKPLETPVFCSPGYESKRNMLVSHNLSEILDMREIETSVNSIQRILMKENLQQHQKLIDLELFAIRELLRAYTDKGPEMMEGWLSPSIWWYTSLPQKLSLFRSSSPTDRIIYYYDGDADPVFGIYQNGFIPKESILNIKRRFISDSDRNNLWMKLDYISALAYIKEKRGGTYGYLSRNYGEIRIPSHAHGFEYSDLLGMRKTR